MTKKLAISALATALITAVSASVLDGGLAGVPHPHLNFLQERDSSSDCSSGDDDPVAMKLIRNMQGRDFFDYWDFVRCSLLRPVSSHPRAHHVLVQHSSIGMIVSLELKVQHTYY